MIRATLLTVLLAACASPNPALYTLDLVPGPVRPAALVVTVREASVPKYLDRQEVVVASGGARVRVADNDWWGEPLPAMIRRVLIADLAQRLPNATVLEGGGPISARTDAELEVALDRFDRDGAGPVVLSGHYGITRNRPRPPGRLGAEMPAGTTIKTQVDAMSAALGQAADTIAAALAP